MKRPTRLFEWRRRGFEAEAPSTALRAVPLPRFAGADGVGAWIAHAAHADTWRLRHAIFRGGRFDPAGALEAWTAPCRRILRGGSWNNTPDNLRSANRNRNTTETRNNNIGFRLGRTLSVRAGAITVAPGVH